MAVSRVFTSPWLKVDKLDLNNKQYYAVPSLGGVMIMLFDVDLNQYIMVKQIRVPVLYNNIKDSEIVGLMLEFCAGHIESDDTDLKQRAVDEVLEETGYDITIDQLEFLEKDYTCVGISGAPIYIFKANVTQSQKVLDGGGDENEDISVINVTADYLIKQVFNNSMELSPLTKYLILKYIKG